MTRDEMIAKARTLLGECEKLEGDELQAREATYAEVIKGIKQFDELAALDPPTKKVDEPVVQGRTPRIEVTDTGDRELEKHFVDALKGREVPDKAMDQFQHKNAGFKAGASALKVPKSLMKHFLSPRMLDKIQGRVDTLIPILSTDDPGPANTFQLPIGQMLHAEAEPTRLMEMVTTVPAPLGGIKFPKIEQKMDDENEYGAVEVTWESAECGEAAEKEETELKIGQVEVATHEVRAYTEVSDTALRRSVIFEPWLTRMLREATGDAVEVAVVVGDGVFQPEGISVAPIREVIRVGTGIQYADLVNLKYALRNNHRARGVFIVQDKGLQALEIQMGAVDNRPIYNSSVAEGMYSRLIGRPYFGSHRMPAVNQTGDIVFLDPASYVLAVETDIVIRRSEHYKFRNNVTAFAVFMLVGGRVVLPRLAVRLMFEGATTTSTSVGGE